MLCKRDIFSLVRKCDMRRYRSIFACGERYAAYGGVRGTDERLGSPYHEIGGKNGSPFGRAPARSG